VKAIFLPIMPVSERTQILEGPQASPVCPDNSSVKMKMGIEYWWSDTDRGKATYWDINII